jgi:hypothetical protein
MDHTLSAFQLCHLAYLSISERDKNLPPHPMTDPNFKSLYGSNSLVTVALRFGSIEKLFGDQIQFIFLHQGKAEACWHSLDEGPAQCFRDKSSTEIHLLITFIDKTTAEFSFDLDPATIDSLYERSKVYPVMAGYYGNETKYRSELQDRSLVFALLKSKLVKCRGFGQMFSWFKEFGDER